MSEPPALMVQVPPLTVSLPAGVGLPMSAHVHVVQPGGGGVPDTVRVTVVTCVADAPVPVTVTVYVPPGVDACVVIVMRELLPAVTLVGLKLAPAPLGSPLAVSDTVCADPLMTAVLMVDVPLLPAFTLMVFGFALIEKSLVTVPPHCANLKAPIRVAQLKAPGDGWYWLTYQKVQSSVGSTVISV